MSTHDDIDEFVESTDQYEVEDRLDRAMAGLPIPKSTKKSDEKPGQLTQYTTFGEGYKPATSTVATLPKGCYNLVTSNQGTFAVQALKPSGLLLELPEMRSDHVLSLVERFWSSEKDYKEGNEFVTGGQAFKCGIMLYGPPGSGKSCTIKIITNKMIDKGGTVFNADCHPIIVQDFLTSFSKIEPNRKSVIILEDLDALIGSYGDAYYLEMLDSAKTIDNVMFIATTNYPDKLDPRIYNRPGRFSHVVKIGLPTEKAREAFLRAILKNCRDVEFIVANSDGFSIDHLSALVNAVYREHKDLKEEMERLRKLFKVPKAEDSKQLGLA